MGTVTYLDHAATTPMRPAAIEAMTRELGLLGNPSSLHAVGRRARRVVEESREIIADAFNARPSEVVFTGGGTESDNLAIKGVFWARRAADPRRRRVLAGATEHHAVLDAVEWLGEHEGARLGWIPVDEHARVDPSALRELITGGSAAGADDVALITTMWANNEVGTVQPVAELAAIAREHGIPFHTDAVQAAGQLPVDFAASGAHSLALTGHKIGGPLGVGALLLAKGVDPVPLLHGGGQERDVRSGTLDTPAIAGFAAAVQEAVRDREEHTRHLTGLRDELIERIRQEVPDAVLNGHPTDRLPGNVHFSFPGCEGDALLMLLDGRGIECSTGSACSAGVAQPSHVLLAMGADIERARGSLRFSLGHTSTRADVEAVAAVISHVVERARRAGLS